MTLVLVALAGAAGAVTRYGIGRAVGATSFPWATLGINLLGSFLLGLALVLAVERDWADVRTVPLTVGFLGAFTTFSTFSYETFALVHTHRPVAAGVYVTASMVGGVLAAAVGYSLARAVA